MRYVFNLDPDRPRRAAVPGKPFSLIGSDARWRNVSPQVRSIGRLQAQRDQLRARRVK